LPIQLASVGPGAVVGEIAFYLQSPRSASIVAADPVVAWRFSRADLDRLAHELPEAAVGFHQAMAEMLSQRLTATNQLVRFLAD
jgi:SulP family sulfate permease